LVQAPQGQRHRGLGDGEILLGKTGVVRIRAGGLDGVIPGVDGSLIRGRVNGAVAPPIFVAEARNPGGGGGVDFARAVIDKTAGRKESDRGQRGRSHRQAGGAGRIVIVGGIVRLEDHPITLGPHRRHGGAVFKLPSSEDDNPGGVFGRAADH